MKKLSLGKLRLSGKEVLERSQLVSIYGGSGGSGSEECSVCYLFENNGFNQAGKVIATLSSAGHCDAGSICFNYPGCFTWDCH